MPNNIFRIFNPEPQTTGKEDRVQKRRAQLRKAQETYRNRKECYVKDLERDVAKSRAREFKLMQENEQLNATIHNLAGLLQQQGVSIPAATVLPELSPPGSTTIPGSSPSQWSEVTMVNSVTSPPLRRYMCVADVDPTDLGVEFVLTLEKPCLDHLHGDPESPQSPSNHALTLSSQMCAASDPTALMACMPAQEPDHHLLPAAMLRNLLYLSKALQASDEEVTPVQAWHYIRSQQHFESFKVQSLQTLATALGGTIKCHGFGAVMKRDVFKRLAFEILLSPRL